MRYKNLIRRIQLNNFMCHDNFQIEFENMITCITGRNGSGKSAVMVSLGLVFGQKSSQMDRGNTFAELIKNGKDNATITVYLSNIHNLPGFEDEIVIQKRLYNAPKKSETRIRKSGKFTVITKSELDLVTKEMNLTFSNPINFLTQDNSKKILNVTTPNELYRFYYEGTEFKNIEEEIEEGEERIEKMNEKMKQTASKLDEFQNKANATKKVLKFVSKDFRKVLEELDWEEEWIEVKENKMKMIEQQTKLDEVVRQLEVLDTEVRSTTIDIPRVELIDTKEFKTKLAEVTNDYTAIKADYEKSTSDFRQREQTYKAAKARNNKEVLVQKITKLTETCESYEKEKKMLESEQMAIFDKVDEEKERNKTVETRRRAISNTVQEIRNKQSALYSTVFKRKFDGLRRALRSKIEAGHFKDVIIGPICDYVNLNDKKWYKPASIILKKSLDNFVVFNSEDKNKLFQVLREQNVFCSILLLQSKQVIDPKKFSDYKTLLDVIDVKFDIIRNVLITMHGAEETVLIEERSKAYEIAQLEGNRIGSVYLPTGDRIKCVRGNMSDYRERETGKYFFEDSGLRMETLLLDLKKCVQTNEWIQKDNELNKKQADLYLRLKNEQMKLDDCKSELKSYDTMKDDDLVQLERKLAVMNKQSASMKNKKESLEQIKLDAEKQLQEAERANIEGLRKQREVQNEQMKKHRQYYADKERINTQIKMYKQALEMTKRAIANKTESLLTKGSEAVDNPRTKEQVDEQRAKTHGLIKRAEDLGTKAEIENELLELEGEKNNLLNIYSNFKGSVEMTKDAVKHRKLKRDEIKNKKTVETIQAFREFTATSGYDGELVFDHVSKKLDLKMRVHNNTVKGNKNTLSGGERSFAGVCFLLSLWSSFNCPVKILDEFDVFMDAENRKNAIKRICEFVRTSHCQIILITPLEVGDIQKQGGDVQRIEKRP